MAFLLLQAAPEFNSFTAKKTEEKREKEKEQEEERARREGEEEKREAREEERQKEELQRRAIQDALNKQTFGQCRSTAQPSTARGNVT